MDVRNFRKTRAVSVRALSRPPLRRRRPRAVFAATRRRVRTTPTRAWSRPRRSPEAARAHAARRPRRAPPGAGRARGRRARARVEGSRGRGPGAEGRRGASADDGGGGRRARRQRRPRRRREREREDLGGAERRRAAVKTSDASGASAALGWRGVASRCGLTAWPRGAARRPPPRARRAPTVLDDVKPRRRFAGVAGGGQRPGERRHAVGGLERLVGERGHPREPDRERRRRSGLGARPQARSRRTAAEPPRALASPDRRRALGRSLAARGVAARRQPRRRRSRPRCVARRRSVHDLRLGFGGRARFDRRHPRGPRARRRRAALARSRAAERLVVREERALVQPPAERGVSSTMSVIPAGASGRGLPTREPLQGAARGWLCDSSCSRRGSGEGGRAYHSRARAAARRARGARARAREGGRLTTLLRWSARSTSRFISRLLTTFRGLPCRLRPRRRVARSAHALARVDGLGLFGREPLALAVRVELGSMEAEAELCARGGERERWTEEVQSARVHVRRAPRPRLAALRADLVFEVVVGEAHERFGRLLDSRALALGHGLASRDRLRRRRTPLRDVDVRALVVGRPLLPSRGRALHPAVGPTAKRVGCRAVRLVVRSDERVSRWVARDGRAPEGGKGGGNTLTASRALRCVRKSSARRGGHARVDALDVRRAELPPERRGRGVAAAAQLVERRGVDAARARARRARSRTPPWSRSRERPRGAAARSSRACRRPRRRR